MDDRGRLPLEKFEEGNGARGSPGSPLDEKALPFQLAARGSYIAPILAVAVGMFASALFGHRQSVRGALIVGAINLVILGAGTLLALIGLLGIRKHGTRGLLWPALAGAIINLAFIGIITVQWVQLRRGN